MTPLLASRGSAQVRSGDHGRMAGQLRPPPYAEVSLRGAIVRIVHTGLPELRFETAHVLMPDWGRSAAGHEPQYPRCRRRTRCEPPSPRQERYALMRQRRTL